ncbi:MAG: hypothetical protein ACTSU5_19915, partial [Promethearchaeota archaeon]
IREYKAREQELAEMRKLIEKRGWLKEREEIKDVISQQATTLQHLEGDIENNKNQYFQALEKLKEQRENLQSRLKEETGQDIKVQITFTF